VSGCFSTSHSGTPVTIAKIVAANGMFIQNQCISLLLQTGLHVQVSLVRPGMLSHPWNA
jgi:hypothetical protein